MSPTVRPVILSGGSGTRLWPLSTTSAPKQFLELLDEPLFEATLGRVDEL
ncbi:MAG TPA: sugar phosphate nucleotidyltransferase, partial [Acidimicrobiia bacterium]|nr:sugar phosphate nucleotidyltransferase [Acidimicrobiia bacterium]